MHESTQLLSGRGTPHAGGRRSSVADTLVVRGVQDASRATARRDPSYADFFVAPVA